MLSELFRELPTELRLRGGFKCVGIFFTLICSGVYIGKNSLKWVLKSCVLYYI